MRLISQLSAYLLQLSNLHPFGRNFFLLFVLKTHQVLELPPQTMFIKIEANYTQIVPWLLIQVGNGKGIFHGLTYVPFFLEIQCLLAIDLILIQPGARATTEAEVIIVVMQGSGYFRLILIFGFQGLQSKALGVSCFY